MTYHYTTLRYILIFFLYTNAVCIAQKTQLKGIIKDATDFNYLENVAVSIKGTNIKTLSNVYGEFDFNENELPLGKQAVICSKEGYITKYFPVLINKGDSLTLNNILLNYDFDAEHNQASVISLSDQDLDENNETISTVLPLLKATRDVYLTAAAFDFGATFFRPRGLGNEYGKVLINGIEMNKLSDGRPQWSNWGGLNDVQRNQEFSYGLSENDYVFGDLSGTSNSIMRASKYRKGGRISYASSNRTYQGRIMGTYNSGMTEKGWAYTVSISRRFGKEGFVEGTLYDANSFFVSIEKRLNSNHSINFTGIYAPNRRGRSTAITDEVYQIKGNTYNPNWGYQNGRIRNARERVVEEPILMVNHYWNLSKNTRLQTNIAIQKGSIANSRIDNGGSDLLLTNGNVTYLGGGRSVATNPVHPDNLPSSFLKDPNPGPLDFQGAFLAQQKLIDKGQIEWDELIKTNQQSAKQGKNATYILYDDKIEDTQIIANTIFDSNIGKNVFLNAALHYKSLHSENFAEVSDLLGGNGFLDVDVFALSVTDRNISERVNNAQSDLRNPNRIVKVGDRYDYNYSINATKMDGFVQGRFKFNRFNFFVSGTVSKTTYQREGLFENGYFPGALSYGKSKSIDFMNFGAKSGGTLTINGHQFFNFHAAYFTKPPTIRNSFANSRQNNFSISEITGKEQENEKIQSIDASYILRTSKIKAKLTGYYTKTLDATKTSFFFTEAISGSNTGFVQELLTDIDKLHIGGELGIEYQIIPELKVKGVAAIGKFTFDNNPNLILTSTSDVFEDFNGVKDFGKSYLKGYHLSSGPQRAAQLGFEYKDPTFWWFGTTVNYFSNAYINVSPFARTSNFVTDSSGQTFNDFDQNIAKELLRQEEFDDYFLVNAVGGKSWRIKKYTIGFFASITNIFNQEYKTGGFEQSRNANYRLALAESRRKTPVFGPKYFFGFGTSYYMNMYVRF